MAGRSGGVVVFVTVVLAMVFVRWWSLCHDRLVDATAVGRGHRPVEQFTDTGTPAGRGEEHLHPRVDLGDVRAKGRSVEFDCLRDVGLGHHHQVGEAEGGGVLQRFVLPSVTEASTTRRVSPRS